MRQMEAEHTGQAQDQINGFSVAEELEPLVSVAIDGCLEQKRNSGIGWHSIAACAQGVEHRK
jgi:hypothetical protein